MADADERGMDGIDLYADVDDFAPEVDSNEADLYDDVISSSATRSVVRGSGLVLSQADTSADGDIKLGDRGQIKSGGFNKRNAVIVANLTWWTTDRDITDAIANCGVSDLKDIKFYENRVNGQSKGFATVLLDSERSCRLVIEKLPSRELHGQAPIVTLYTRAALDKFDTNPSTSAASQSSARTKEPTNKEPDMNSFQNGNFLQPQQPPAQPAVVNPLAGGAARLSLPSVGGPPPQLPPTMQLPNVSTIPPVPQNAAAAAAAFASVRGLIPGGLLPPGGKLTSSAGFVLPPGGTRVPPPGLPSSIPIAAVSGPPQLTLPGAGQNQPPLGLNFPPPLPGQLPPMLQSLGLPPPMLQSLPPPRLMASGSQPGAMLRVGPPSVVDVRSAPPPVTPPGTRPDFLHLRPPPGSDPFQAAAAALQQQQQQRPGMPLPPLGMLGGGAGAGGISIPPPHFLLPPLSGAAPVLSMSSAVPTSLPASNPTHLPPPTFYPPTGIPPVSHPQPMMQLDAYGRPIGAAQSSTSLTTASVSGPLAAGTAVSMESAVQPAVSVQSSSRRSPMETSRRTSPGYSSSATDHYHRHHRSRSPAVATRDRDSSVDSYHRASPRTDSRSRRESAGGSGTGGGSGAHYHQLSSAEFEEILQRNKTVSSSAISRAVQDASAGEFVSAIETLVTAIALIKQSRISNDDRCRILISSLQDTLHGIESKSYTSSGGSSGYSKGSSSHRHRSPGRGGGDRNGGGDKSRGGDYHRSRSRDRAREYSSRSGAAEHRSESSRHYESSDRRDRDREYRDRDRDDREYSSRSSRH